MSRLAASTLLVQTCRRILLRTCTRPSITSTSNILISSNQPLSSSSTASTSNMMRRFIGMASAVAPSSSPPDADPLSSSENYENAIRLLNTLQSNAATISKIRQNPSLKRSTSLPQTTAALLQSGLSLSSIDNLQIIHVAGTKGKGMTCAFTESILRQAGLKTGFFSSPHLTAVRERIRLNGRPLTESHFARTFFHVFNKLKHLQQDNHNEACEMPHYFRFLMVMAFHVFLEESVDVVILEVGIGGKFDSTNFISRPVAVGISSLGLEHQQVLGGTLEEIAAQKAGIMKPSCPAFTVQGHPPHIQDLLRNTAKEVDCPLQFVETRDFEGIPLGVDDDLGGVARINASLALKLANELLFKKYSHIFPAGVTSPGGDDLLPFQKRGLALTRWPGRFQKIPDPHRRRITYFLDGAHTVDSLKVTSKWFSSSSPSTSTLRLLIFNLTGDRDSSQLMEPLIPSEFDLAIFCPFIASTSPSSSSPADCWSALGGNDAGDPLEDCRKLARTWEGIQTTSKGVCLGSAEETLEYIREVTSEGEGGRRREVHVLITGSLHLIGTFLRVLQPNRNDDFDE